jgi:nicotinate-nucleotide pyrophosphorylase (carboxylating)
MPGFTPAETAACRALIDSALREDLGEAGDLTTQAFIPASKAGTAVLVVRSEGVLAGLPAAELVFQTVDSCLEFRPLCVDGSGLKPGDRLARITGSIRSILTGERTALNFMQRLSGVATLTRRYVEAIAGLPAKILDTRKTTPGWRLLEKYAVRMGGGYNHRMGLYDGILIKDNHLAAVAGETDPVGLAIRRARQHAGVLIPVEIEVEALAQFDRALACQPNMILLDNMNIEQMTECVRRRNAAGAKTQLEASGGITLATVRSVAQTGVDRISVGALTHSAVALDLALDYE